MLLVIDVGNTAITTGIYNENMLVGKACFDSDISLSAEEYKNIFIKEYGDEKITCCIISSVVKELTQTIKSAIKKAFEIEAVIVDSSLSTELKLDVELPETVGADRIANSYAVLKKYSLPAIVVDMGTATTFDIVDKSGAFSGGVIMPGIGMQLKALGTGTSLLPELRAENIEKAIGRNTKDCILSGVIKGQAHAIEGLIKDCESELGSHPVIVATGGYAKLVKHHMVSDCFDVVEPDLTLEGLKLIYENIK